MITKEEIKTKLEELIKDYQSYDKEEKDSMSEDATRRKFVDRLLKEVLGWDEKNLDSQTPIESLTPEGHMKRADYSYPKVPTIIVEAKKLKVQIDDGDYDKQVTDYAYSKAVNWAILTNFKSFRVWYVTRKKIDWFCRLNILEDNINQTVEELFYFTRDNVLNGVLDKRAEVRGIKLQDIDITSDLTESLNMSRQKINNYLKRHYDKRYSDGEREELTQGIINRLIFIKKVEAEGIEENKLEQIIRKERSKVYNKITEIFSYYRENYDSDVFGLPVERSEVEKLDIDDSFALELLKVISTPLDSERAYNFAAMNADVLGNIYENYLSYVQKGIKLVGGKTSKRGQGIYYTPKEIVNYIVNQTIIPTIKKKSAKELKRIKILDPACGSGSFIIVVIKRLTEYYSEKYKDYDELSMNQKLALIKDSVFAVDLDEKAIAIAKLNIYLELLTQQKQSSMKMHHELLPELKSNIKVGNSLIDDTKIVGNSAFKWYEEFSPVFGDGGFDIIIGNPPYISYNMKGGEKMNDEAYKYYKNTYDFLTHSQKKPRLNSMMFFVERSLKNLKEGGKLGFILNQNFLNVNSFKEIRKFILDNTEIDILVTDVEFPHVIADTFIIILTKKKADPTHKIKWISDINNSDSYINILQTSFLKNENFEFITGHNEDLLKKIEKDAKLLDDVAFVRRGMQITKDDFLSDTQISQKYHRCISNDNLNRYSLIWPSQAQIDGTERKKFIIFDKNLEKKVNQRLEKSGSSTRIGIGKDESRFNKDKLLVRQAPARPELSATFDSEKYYADYTVHVINQKEIPLKLILAILNSKLMTFYAVEKKLLYSGKKRVPQIMAKKLKRLPIKTNSDSEQIINLVDERLRLSKQLLDFGNKKIGGREKIEEDILKTDKKIDNLVYKLYGITEEEKKVIEENRK